MESSDLQNLSIAELEAEADRLRAAYQQEFGADIPDAQKSLDTLRIEGIEAQKNSIAADWKKKGDAIIHALVRVQNRIKVLQRSAA